MEGFDDEVVYGEPDGAAPVGVASEHGGGGFAGGVGDFVAFFAVFEDEGFFFVGFTEGADAVGGEKFAGVEEAGDAFEEAIL